MILRYSSLNSRFLALLFVAFVLSLSTWFATLGPRLPPSLVPISVGGFGGSAEATAGKKPPSPSKRPEAHPIDALLLRARQEWHQLLTKETSDLTSAAKEYREKRGRHPPPGFDKWFEFAMERDAIIVEDFFDQIYHDLGPFWGLPAETVRRAAKNFDFVVSVRDGKTTQKSDGRDRPWMNLWQNLVETIVNQTYVPDLDMAINVMDESRVIAPWEDINSYMKKADQSRAKALVTPAEAVTAFTGLEALDANPGEPVDPQFVGNQHFWDLAKVGCAPDSPFRKAEFTDDFTGPPPMPTTEFPAHSHHGYVANWTKSKDPCIQPELQGSHGTFVEPISKSTTHVLFPMFGGSKLPMNNEILIPPAMYWSDNDFYTGGSFHGGPWSEKKDALIWRGAATGGRNKPETWTRFQRHRFVNMLNGSAVSLAEATGSAPNFDPSGHKPYKLKSLPRQQLGAWLSSFSDVGFYDLLCLQRPEPPEDPSKCSYTSHYFDIVKQVPMKDQYSFKYLPDVDGNSFSGRYWGFLWSTSLPIKATIYNEWHDSRLIPWLHFVPMHNSFVDIYGILDYFLGNTECKQETETPASNPDDPDKPAATDASKEECNPGHDKEAERIATAGKEWAEKVLRREDMQIYVYRLLLEYARICDDAREKMGFVADLDPSRDTLA